MESPPVAAKSVENVLESLGKPGKSGKLLKNLLMKVLEKTGTTISPSTLHYKFNVK
jgi:hypothetical protein